MLNFLIPMHPQATQSSLTFMHIIRICGAQMGLLKGLLLSHDCTKSVFIKRTSLKTNLAWSSL